LEKELIHTRTIKVNCYETDEDRLVVEGDLLDERHEPIKESCFRHSFFCGRGRGSS